MKKYINNKWYKYIIPKRVTLPPVRLYRWLNFYFRLKNKKRK